jgi:thiol-disulfide isomerase/thioredoxin
LAATASTMLPLGTNMPGFMLTDTVSGKLTRSSDIAKGKKAMVVMFLCNHCPYVKHIRAEVAKLARDYAPKGVGFAAISSNDVDAYPDDCPALMKQEAAEAGYTFPYLYDEDQTIAKVYRAACTPDFYLFDATGKLFYRGQLDDTRPRSGMTAHGKDLRHALDLVLRNGASPPERQMPSLGCNIKWKPGCEPDYAR